MRVLEGIVVIYINNGPCLLRLNFFSKTSQIRQQKQSISTEPFYIRDAMHASLLAPLMYQPNVVGIVARCSLHRPLRVLVDGNSANHDADSAYSFEVFDVLIQ